VYFESTDYESTSEEAFGNRSEAILCCAANRRRVVRLQMYTDVTAGIL